MLQKLLFPHSTILPILILGMLLSIVGVNAQDLAFIEAQEISKKERKDQLDFSGKQTVIVSGTVKSQENSETLPGVNVRVKGTNIGTVTDLNGSFTINVPNANDTLTFSFIGFQSQEVPLNGRTSVEVLLQEDVKSLQEVVVE